MSQRAPRNRTLIVRDSEQSEYESRLLKLTRPVDLEVIVDHIIWQDSFEALPLLPQSVIDLLVLDPPYNLNKRFNEVTFQQLDDKEYAAWLDRCLASLVRLLKPTASIYVCGDWRSSAAIQTTLGHYFTIRNRITWEREKGRGARANWKNCSEDIWYCTMSEQFTFHVDAVMVKRRVIAPYRTETGEPKDWTEDESGQFRLTHPSNLWTDITIPFWSMPENTDHPTQKPEKLIAKLILASTNPGDVVLDPFLGSGTTAVVAKKLGRRFIGVEMDRLYCCLAAKRLDMASRDPSIQGYQDGVFWERNSLGGLRKMPRQSTHAAANASMLFSPGEVP